MLCLDNVSVSYKGRRVLEGIGFRAYPGEITVLLGRNGCGKSTLLRAIAGCIGCSGEISCCGSRLSALKPRERAKLVSMMAQSQARPELTVRELVLCARQPYAGIFGGLSDADYQAADLAIERVGISRLSDRLLTEISGGEAQKAYFAMLSAQDTPVILLDEPTSSLDTVSRSELTAQLKRFADSGKTVLAVLHDLNAALAISDRIIVLAANEREPSRIVFDGEPGAFGDSGIAERIFGLKAQSGVFYL